MMVRRGGVTGAAAPPRTLTAGRDRDLRISTPHCSACPTAPFVASNATRMSVLLYVAGLGRPQNVLNALSRVSGMRLGPAETWSVGAMASGTSGQSSRAIIYLG